LIYTQNDPTTDNDIWSLPLDGERHPRAIVQTRFNEEFPEISADGRWLAYTSNESGRREVYVQPYPGPGPRQQVSVDGGSTPAWSRDGKELFYQARSPDIDTGVLRLMAVSVSTQPTFTAGMPRRLWQRPYPLTLLGYRGYDVSADGKRFLVVAAGERTPIKVTEMILIQNWTEELKRLVPTK
jgi:dipeptidyl aminopeptidase/acylaminoacyl peptidase